MAHFSRQKYRSRRDKYQTVSRNTRVFLIFAAVAIVILVYKNRWDIWLWFKDGLGI